MEEFNEFRLKERALIVKYLKERADMFRKADVPNIERAIGIETEASHVENGLHLEEYPGCFGLSDGSEICSKCDMNPVCFGDRYYRVFNG